MKTQKNLVKNLVLAASLLMAATASADSNIMANNLKKIVDPGKAYQGHTYNELVNEWTQWLVREPIATNPAFDVDGSLCGSNQSGDVWFLASTFSGVAERTCDIPADKALFVSLGGAFVSFAPDFPEAGDPCLALSSTIDKVRCDLTQDLPGLPHTTMDVTLDGVGVKDLFAYRAPSAPGGFELQIKNPSLLTDLGVAPGNRFPAVADGYFLLIKPLKPGVHRLSFRMNNGSTVTGVDYTLNVAN
jgi:hypothetical protein